MIRRPPRSTLFPYRRSSDLAQYVGDDFMLSTIDIVQDPSAPSAFVNGVMEGVEWVWDNGVLQPQDIEIIETEIKSTPRRGLPEVEIKAFKNFLSKINSQNNRG